MRRLISALAWPRSRNAAGATPRVGRVSFHRDLGVAVGEHLGYLFAGSWSALTGVALMQATNTAWWLGLAGLVVGGLLMVCSFELVGAFEEQGWRVAAVPTPIASVAWSLWLIAVGNALLLAELRAAALSSQACQTASTCGAAAAPAPRLVGGAPGWVWG